MSYRTKIALSFGAATLLISASFTYYNYQIAVREMTLEFGRKLQAVVATAATGIDGDAFDSLRHPEQMASSEYKAIQNYLRLLRKVNRHIQIKYFYTMRPAEKPRQWRYVVDSEPQNSDDFSALGERDELKDAESLHAMEYPVATKRFHQYEKWGNLLSAYAPIKNKKGRSVGILGVDASAQTVEAAAKAITQSAFASMLLGIFVSLMASFILASQVTRPVSLLIAGTKAAAKGEFEQKVIIRSKDEMGKLADSFNAMLEGLRQRDLYKKQFERYVSPQVASKILDEPDRVFWTGERRLVTILFSDIRGFTFMSEHLDPETILFMLNEYFSAMIKIIFTNDGTLDKFIGDAIMAVFGAPISLGRDEERAVRTAVAMIEATESLSDWFQKLGFPRINIGIGINTGEAVIGNIGSELRLEYTAIGDTVNLASRLESLNKEYGSSILIAENTYKGVEHIVKARFVDKVNVRGRLEPVSIYEVLGIQDNKGRTSSV